MSPKSACDGLDIQNPVSKSASSRHRSSALDDDEEQLFFCTENSYLADSDIITSPRDYLKTFNKPCNLFQGKEMESSPAFAALSKELQRALTRVHELEYFQTSARKEVDGLLRRFADERALLKNREQEKIQAAVFLIEEELDKEQKIRKILELENRKLSRSLAQANRTVVKAEKDLHKERKARLLMEDVCDELAREIGEDKAEVEELKREHARAREEIEEERRTLQMTEAWREERVQMKLSDAKYELEKRCVTLDKLALELELFLNAQQAHQGEEAFYNTQGEYLRTATEKLKAEAFSYMQNLEIGSSHGPQLQSDTLSSDDIHSLRLSRDNLRSQHEWTGYSDAFVRDRTKWSFDYARELGKHIAIANDTENESSNLLSTLDAYPNVHKSCFSPKRVSKWAKNRESIEALVDKCSGLTFDGSDSGEERILDEENGIEDDANAAWGHNKFGTNEDRESNGHVEADLNISVLKSKVDEECDASEERDSEGSSSPKFSRWSKQRGFKGNGRHLNQGFFGTGKKHIHHNFLDDASQSADDVDGASSITRLSSPIYECSGDGLGPNGHKEGWPVVPIYGSASQGRRAAATSSAASRRRNILQWGKLSSDNHGLQTTLFDDRKSRQYLQARYPKGQRLTR